MTSVVCISDTHLQHNIKVPPADILIHAGDALCYGNLRELNQFGEWFRALPHPHKIFIAGNHDRVFESAVGRHDIRYWPRVTYLEDQLAEIEIDGRTLSVYGSPWQPEFFNWAFNLPRGGFQLQRRWAAIPKNLDILVTHGPPQGILDQSRLDRPHIGCELLLEAVERVKPRFHIFGHCHGGYGTATVGDTTFVNAAICDEQYRPTHKPIVIEV